MKDALEIKAEAEANGLVTWIDASDPRIGGTSCSCCGDCCHFMRRVTEFNAPASIAPPHFRPKIDPEKCNYCGQCALSCPMAATTVDLVNKKYTLDIHRCIGCAQCVVACSKNKAIEMVAVSGCEEFQQTGIGVFF
jgi:Pyruvate/2-oxoacid:ferredoxin oxidoreductase delta subunit